MLKSSLARAVPLVLFLMPPPVFAQTLNRQAINLALRTVAATAAPKVRFEALWWVTQNELEPI